MNNTITKLNIKTHEKKSYSKKDKDKLDVKSCLSNFQIKKQVKNRIKITNKPENGNLIQALDKFVDGVYISDKEHSLL